MSKWRSPAIALPAIVLAGVMSSHAALAQTEDRRDARPGWSVKVGAATTGIVATAQYRFNDKLALRGFAGSAFLARIEGQVSGIDYKFDAELGGVGLLADYYLFGRGARISGGLFYSMNSATGRTQGDLTIGDTTYRGVAIEGDVAFARQISPILSLGYDLPLGERLMLSADVGAILNNGFTIDIRQTAGPEILPEDIRLETSQFSEESADFYPFLSLSIAYRF